MNKIFLVYGWYSRVYWCLYDRVFLIPGGPLRAKGRMRQVIQVSNY